MISDTIPLLNETNEDFRISSSVMGLSVPQIVLNGVSLGITPIETESGTDRSEADRRCKIEVELLNFIGFWAAVWNSTVCILGSFLKADVAYLYDIPPKHDRE